MTDKLFSILFIKSSTMSNVYFIPNFCLPFFWERDLKDKVKYQKFTYFNGVYNEQGILLLKEEYCKLPIVIKFEVYSEKQSNQAGILEVMAVIPGHPAQV
ncbi:MAG TPA: hypothetical protein VF941_02685 [Clostridia bacterium]